MVAAAAVFLATFVLVLLRESALTNGEPGGDFRVFRELGRRWLETGSMYAPYQLVGPYSKVMTWDAIEQTPGLYPPPLGPVFAALSLISAPIAASLWWGVPIAVVAWAVWRWRPAPWTWPVMAACLAYPEWALWSGGSSLWMAAAVAAGLVWRWPAVLIIVKPTLAPFALIGIGSRWWWVGLAVLGVLTIIGPWRDYLAVSRNVSDLDPLHSLREVPLLLLPLVAWLGRRR